MIYNNVQEPFEHLIISDFLTFEESKFLYYSCCNKINEQTYDDRSLFNLDDMNVQTSVGLFGVDVTNELNDKIFKQLYTISTELGFSSNEWEWVGGLNVTNPDISLGPHTDEYEYVKKSNPNAGILKVLIYIGDNKEDYSGWGTRLYNGNDKNRNFVKEVEFVPGTALLFKATNKSYHGTEFPLGINSYRFIFGAELTDIK